MWSCVSRAIERTGERGFADHGVDRMVKVGQADAGGACLPFRLGADVVLLPGRAFP
jgi:hypothetical protein